MRSGGVCSIQHSLTPEAASVLKHSLLLSRRRGHAQLTPLHVAAVLLSSSSTLLNRACLATTTNNNLHSPRAALDLCFNVALNRLPAATGSGAVQPTLSNALVAALKRAQSHHRRGSSSSGAAVENPSGLLTTVKVDIEQLVISILDDPSVSRVMREAGFSSSAVKTTVVEGATNMTLVKDGVLGLTFHANIINYNNNSSVQGSRIRLSQQNPSRHQLISNRDDGQYLPNYYHHNSMNNYNLNNYNYKLSFCSECASNCEKEVELMKTGNQKLPAWLRPNGTQATPQKDELVELRKKWSRLCHSLHHQGSHSTQNWYSNNNIQGHIGNNNYVPWCPSNQNNIIFHDTKNSITFSDHDYPANPGREFNVDPRLDARRSNRQGINDDDGGDEEEKKITLGLGNSVGPQTESSRDEMCRVLKDNVPWQSEAIPSIVEALIAKNETWLVLQGNDSIGKRRLARAIAESIIGSADSLVRLSGRRDEMGTLEKALRLTKKLVVLVEEIDNLIDTMFLKSLSDRFEIPKSGEEERLIFILTKSDGDERRMKRKDDLVIEMTLEIDNTRGFLDRKRKGVGLEKPNHRWKSSRIDLNIEAGLDEEEEEEMSRDSSDLTRENDIINDTKRALFFESIESVFEFNRSPARDREMKEFFEAKMVSRCFNDGEEIMALICGKKVRFIVDESVLEEVSFGSSCFTHSLFEKWVRGVLENALKMVVSFRAKEKGKNGILCGGVGGGDGLVVRLCLGGEKREGINLVDGFMGSCLPNKIQISYKD